MNKLEGKKITLRAVEPEDLEWLYRWENDSSVWQAGITLAPFSRYVLREYLANAQQDIFEAKQLRLMIDTLDGETLGTIDLFDFDPMNQRAGVGILIGGNDNRRQGYAADALSVLIAYAFDVLKLHQLYCNIARSNTASLALFQNSGFVVCGEKKDWLRTSDGWEDEVMLQMVK